jgi:hypothetical protein
MEYSLFINAYEQGRNMFYHLSLLFFKIQVMYISEIGHRRNMNLCSGEKNIHAHILITVSLV